mgnify:CR=1 FL=1
MLVRKMLREFKTHFGALFSVFILSALAMALYCTMEGHVLAQKTTRQQYHDTCSLSDLWVYGESFTKENLEAVRSLDFVESAQLRTGTSGTAPDFDGAQVDFYLEDENVVNTPYYIEGEAFDAQDADGVWLANAFAVRRGIKVGDDFTIEYEGIRLTKKVKGLVESAEYEFRQADGDADVYLENIAVAYLSYHALDSLNLVFTVPYTQLVIRTKDTGGLAHEEAVAEKLNHEYSTMIDRKSVPGLARLDSELDQHQMFSYVFIVIFVGIAILVIVTTMGRMVEKQRTLIGTMNALGLKRSKILFHYISYSLVVTLAGTVLGTMIGTVWLCPVLVNMFEDMYVVPGLHAGFHVEYIYIAVLVIAACLLSSYAACRKLLKVKPAEALRPAAPKQGKRCIFEKLPFWKKLSFESQYNLRDISRAKLRSFMCVVGTAVGMLLMVYAVGCNQLVEIMLDIMFEKTAVSEYQVKLSQKASVSDATALAQELDGELVMTGQIEVSKVKNATAEEKKKENITVLEGKNLYNVLDVNNRVMNLTPGSVAVSRKLAADMDIHVGDTIYWHLYSKNEWYEAKVGAVYRSTETQGIAYLRADYEKTGAAYTPTLLMTNKNPQDKKDLDFVTAVNSKQELEDTYTESMQVINIMIVMMAAFSVIMVVVVLYNSGVLSFNERVKEFATLKVLGLRSSKIRRLLSRQNMALSLIGIVLGAPLGNISLNAMINSNGDNFDYYLTVPIPDYFVAGFFVLAVSMLVSFMFSKKIQQLDMVEVLKGVE